MVRGRAPTDAFVAFASFDGVTGLEPIMTHRYLASNKERTIGAEIGYQDVGVSGTTDSERAEKGVGPDEGEDKSTRKVDSRIRG